MERRLAAILVADVVGYSRLTEADEEHTRALFQSDLENVFMPNIRAHHGRLVKTLGDGLLVEFHSVVDALRCAVSVQQQKATENADVRGNRQLRFRIGINLGDILVEGDDIHGDGVNIADRVQGLAEAGGTAISGSAYDQVKTKSHVGYVSLGRRKVKGILEPVRVYRVVADPTALRKNADIRKSLRAALLLATCGLLPIILLIWPVPWSVFQLPPSTGRVAYPLPDKPSVAVMPFINVSGDATHDHLAEGLTDGLITELSKVSGLFVIARHSVVTVRNASATVQDVASELGVRYVLEGTLQRDGLRLRINVKLIEAMTGLSLWAEKYDRLYADLFAVQDDVIGKIISALAVKLSQGEQKQLARMPTDNLEAYDYFMRAEHEGFIFGDVATYRRTLSYYQKAIDLDPDFANAHAGIARIAVDVWRNDYNFLWSAAIARKIAYDAAGQALKLDPSNARAQTVLALLQWVDGRSSEALVSANNAIAAQPNDPEAYGNLALILAHMGKPQQAIAAIETASRLDPSPAPGFQLLSGIVFYSVHQEERAIPLIEAARATLQKTEPAHEYLAAAYANLGERSRAAPPVAKLLELFPESNRNYYRYLYDYWRNEDRDRHLAALELAGIPEWPFGFNGKNADRITGKQLEEITRNRVWTGRHKNGTSFVQYFDSVGNTAYRSANTNITGIVKIQGDDLCERFEGNFLDRMVCGEVYRNPDPGQNAVPYVSVTPRSLRFFSVAVEGP